VSFLPVVRRTWAPRGQTPVLTHKFSWTKISVSAMVAYDPSGRRRPRLYFQAIQGSYNDETIIDVIKQLRRAFRGEPVVLIWDRLSSHKSESTRAFIAEQRDWLRMELLPPYGHDLNPVEGVWANLKGVDIANVCATTVDELYDVTGAGMGRIRRTPDLLRAFLAKTGLALN
jgi:transposase